MIYTNFMYDFIMQNLNITTDNFKLMLLSDDYVPDKSQMTYEEISAKEIDGTGYIKGGSSLTNVTVVKESGSVVLSADPVSWPNSSITARYGVIYREENGSLVTCFDFGAQKSSLNGSFIIEWPENGFLQLEGVSE